MEHPFFRAAPPEGHPSAPSPPGWSVEPAGLWRGAVSEIVFDPRRHDIVFLRGAVDTTVTQSLSGCGYERLGADNGNQLWVRDRVQPAPRPLVTVSSVRLDRRGLSGA